MRDRNKTQEKSLGINIVLATIPIVIVGSIVYTLSLVDLLRNIQIIALSTIVFGVLLYFADIKEKSQTRSIND